MKIRSCVCAILLFLSNSLFATSTKKVEIDPPADSERARKAETITFTATVKNDSGTVLTAEPIEIWYETKAGVRVKTKPGVNGVASIDIPRNKLQTFNVRAKSGDVESSRVKVTFVDVALLTDDLHFPAANKKGKLLATATHSVGCEKLKPVGEAAPAGTLAWSHPRAEKFIPPDAEETKVTMKAEVTATKDADLLQVDFTITSSNEVCTDTKPLNVTAPTHFASTKNGQDVAAGTFPGAGGFRSDNKDKKVNLIAPIRKIPYTMTDNFDEAMGQTDFADKEIQCRENLPAGWGGFATAVAWAKANINAGDATQGEWRKITAPPDSFTDNIGIQQFPLDILLVSEPVDPNKPKGKKVMRLAPALRQVNADILTLLPHKWEASISAQMAREVANNTFRVYIKTYERVGNIDVYSIGVTYVVKVQE